MKMSYKKQFFFIMNITISIKFLTNMKLFFFSSKRLVFFLLFKKSTEKKLNFVIQFNGIIIWFWTVLFIQKNKIHDSLVIII